MIPLSPTLRKPSNYMDENNVIKSYLYVLSSSSSDKSNTIEDISISNKQISLNQSTYQFNRVFDGYSDFSESSFSSTMSPFVDNAIAGDSSMVLFCGEPAHSITNYLIGSPAQSTGNLSNRWPGLIVQAVRQMLLTQRQAKNDAIITFSWFSIDCSPNESIADVLKSSSSGGAVTTEQLVLREQGKGRGMAVPGLWEVEIASSEDLDKVIGHVLQNNSVLNKGTSHQVLQLSFTAKDKDISGKLSLVILSHLNNPITSTKTTSNLTSRSNKPIATKYPWVLQLEHVLDWIDSKHAAPPFHKSRILLVLRDLLIGRQSGCVCLLMKSPVSADSTTQCSQWLQLVSRISTVLSDSYTSSYVPQQQPLPTFKSKTPVSATIQSANYVPTPRDVMTGGSDKVFTFSPSQVNAQTKSQSFNQSIKQEVSIKEAIQSAKSISSNIITNSQINNDDYAVREREASLKASIQSQQKEIDRLKSQLAEQTNRANEKEEAYNSLIEQLKEEGASLEKKDKERYKKALQDLRDFELYKQVLEATMQRMQTEINNYKLENQELIDAKTYNENVARKNRSQSDKHLIELTAVKKQLANTENKFTDSQIQIQKLTKERDSLSNSVNKLKDELSKLTNRLNTELTAKNKEINELKLNLEIALDDLIVLKSNESMQDQLDNQKKAHTKTLESLMQLQEDNKSLKNKIEELQRSSRSSSSVSTVFKSSIITSTTNDSKRKTNLL
eukprot:CAMPEP_0196761746 /NCGR_PEP_ID=MMETSP1095-20130614/1051_1 /TAXON_ID=96789 ORGANISM="Chromulina nebulosa, Strain UTEXLB2642" /NCGR_SAMPLE_ID=MMETSP1095 /ASSEMBLY_ACC=CAM_ASM_000446 /LENGTH=726 /DNA_ID=CAMNT_0042111675 /DNA_START=15 /DNA_END=2195 /DNA_ORIENTATION=+